MSSGTLRPTRLEVRHPGGAYRVFAGLGALAAAAGELGELVTGRTVFLLSSPVVWELHGASVLARLGDARRVVLLEAPDGEAAKSLEVATRLWREMVAAGGKRDSVLLGLGGGSIGDLGGFVAGAFVRGIPFVPLPTTVLAQVDASVGGKTAVDLPEGKNTVGLFHQPSLVVAETGWLETLPAAERRAGLIESVKMAYCLDPGLFAQIEAELERLLAGHAEVLAAVIAASIAVKAGVVERDPFEAGERRVLNFGHTLGHALETELGYRGLRHGEAVGWGMRFALELAEVTFGAINGAERLRHLLDRFELPVLPPLSPARLLEHIGHDKKATEEGVSWVLPAALGDTRFEYVSSAVVRRKLDELFERPGHEGA